MYQVVGRQAVSCGTVPPGHVNQTCIGMLLAGNLQISSNSSCHRGLWNVAWCRKCCCSSLWTGWLCVHGSKKQRSKADVSGNIGQIYVHRASFIVVSACVQHRRQFAVLRRRAYSLARSFAVSLNLASQLDPLVSSFARPLHHIIAVSCSLAFFMLSTQPAPGYQGRFTRSICCAASLSA